MRRFARLAFAAAVAIVAAPSACSAQYGGIGGYGGGMGMYGGGMGFGGGLGGYGGGLGGYGAQRGGGFTLPQRTTYAPLPITSYSTTSSNPYWYHVRDEAGLNRGPYHSPRRTGRRDPATPSTPGTNAAPPQVRASLSPRR
ncbi:MAG: hypothetical protein JWN86_2277 [Planctomycetota bacterium]|nr:hypothetical protein [Planctomycetota bacterium]